MDQVTLVAVIIAIIKAVKTQVPQVNGLITLALAIALGALAGYLKFQGVSIEQGIVIGISAVGVATTADRIAGK